MKVGWKMSVSISMLNIGTNLGDKEQNIKDAIFMLNKCSEINILKLSSFYETEPYGDVIQDNFFNVGVKIETTLSPLKLLEFCQKIEQELGRVKKEKWGSRIIDIDIITYGNKQINEKNLQIPHPYAHDRLFVIMPLIEIDSNLKVKDIRNNEVVVNTKTYEMSELEKESNLSKWIEKIDNSFIKKTKQAIAKIVFYSNFEHEKAKYTITVSKSKNNNYILVKHKERSYFEIPGGKCESQNYLLEARRELEEETGTKKYDIEYNMSYAIDVQGQFNYTHIYSAKLYDFQVNEKFEMEKVEEFKEIPVRLNYEMHKYVLWVYETKILNKEDKIQAVFYW